MCTTKTPKVSTSVANAAEKKTPIYMRNSYLDGLGMGAESAGRSSLRINKGAPRVTVPVTALSSMGSGMSTGMSPLFMGMQ